MRARRTPTVAPARPSRRRPSREAAAPPHRSCRGSLGGAHRSAAHRQHRRRASCTSRCRLCGLEFAELAVLPVVPFAAFLLLLNGGYVAAFTAAGGQTIGKMAAGIRCRRRSTKTPGAIGCRSGQAVAARCRLPGLGAAGRARLPAGAARRRARAPSTTGSRTRASSKRDSSRRLHRHGRLLRLFSVRARHGRLRRRAAVLRARLVDAVRRSSKSA